MKIRLLWLATAILGLAPGFLLSHSAQADGAKIQVTTPAWKGYQDYLAQMGPSRHGFFAMSKDGQIWGNSGCTTGQCPADDTLKASAIQRCQQFSAGTPCLIFAEDKNTLVPYEVKDYTRYGE
ncbi:MAG TPA: hypothetical protein VGM59_03410 [Dongiaceae bacterium]